MIAMVKSWTLALSCVFGKFGGKAGRPERELLDRGDEGQPTGLRGSGPVSF